VYSSDIVSADFSFTGPVTSIVAAGAELFANTNGLYFDPSSGTTEVFTGTNGSVYFGSYGSPQIIPGGSGHPCPAVTDPYAYGTCVSEGVGASLAEAVIPADGDPLLIGTPAETPLPATLPLFASGIGVLGLLLRGMRKSRSVSVME
jgi:hypothetical protein